ncbi:hypothetical protein ABPG75_000121 [Micractinium tetrahymenae]
MALAYLQQTPGNSGKGISNQENQGRILCTSGCCSAGAAATAQQPIARCKLACPAYGMHRATSMRDLWTAKKHTMRRSTQQSSPHSLAEALAADVHAVLADQAALVGAHAAAAGALAVLLGVLVPHGLERHGGGLTKGAAAGEEGWQQAVSGGGGGGNGGN